MNNLPDNIAQQVRQALQEDIGSGDLTAALLPESGVTTAKIISRQHAVLCGCAWVEEVFRQLDSNCDLRWRKQEGDLIYDNDTICTLTGPAATLLSGERTALNFLQTLSGIATRARRYANAVADYDTRVLDTRKTLPGWRHAEKYAVRCGGCDNHRMGLFDAVLIKENHIRATGSIKAALENARARYPGDTLIEIEVESLEELSEALQSGATRVLLDNFELGDIEQAVSMNRNGAVLEVSGNVTLDNIADIAATGVDFISIGDLTKNITAVDFSMQFPDL